MRAFGHWLNRQPYLLLGLTAVIWAGNAIAGRLARGEISPMLLTNVRWVIACLVLAVIARAEARAAWGVLAARWRFVVPMGALGFTAFNALFYIAAHHTTAVNITILQSAIPAFVLLGAFVLFGTPVGPMQIVGTAVTLVGVAAVAAQGSLANLLDLHFNIGDLWIFLAGLLYAGYTLGLRKRPPVPGLVLFSAFAGVAFVTSVPLVLAEAAMGGLQWPTLTGWAIAVYVALFPSLVAQVFFMRGVELIGPGRAGVFMNLVPVCGAILAVLILNEPFHTYHALALALVVGGIWLAERRESA